MISIFLSRIKKRVMIPATIIESVSLIFDFGVSISGKTERKTFRNRVVIRRDGLFMVRNLNQRGRNIKLKMTCVFQDGIDTIIIEVCSI